jgi:hypothetical protein
MTNVHQDRLFVLALLAVPCVVAVPAIAQQDSDALAGPKVADKSQAKDEPTLMRPSFDGTMEELTERPEVAVLRQLALSDLERSATDKLLAERTIKVNKLLAENLDEVIAMQSLLQEMAGGTSPYLRRPADEDDQSAMKDGEARGERRGERAAEQALRMKVLAMREKAKDLVDPPLVDQIADHLSAENQTKLREAVAEYYRANPAPRRARAGLDARPLRSESSQSPRAAARRETQQLLREVGQALRALVEERQAKFDELVQAVGPTPEQEAKIQAILRDQGVRGQLQPTAAQRTESFRKIMDVLTPEQRTRLREAITR